MSCTIVRLEMVSEAELERAGSSGEDGGERLNLMPADLETSLCQPFSFLLIGI